MGWKKVGSCRRDRLASDPDEIGNVQADVMVRRNSSGASGASVYICI